MWGHTWSSVAYCKIAYEKGCTQGTNRCSWELRNNLSPERERGAGIATSYRLDDRGVGVRVPVGSRLSSSPDRSGRLWGPPNLLSNGYPGVKRPGREVDHSPRTSAEVKKMWIFTSTPTRLHGVVLTLLSRDNFTFTLPERERRRDCGEFTKPFHISWPCVIQLGLPSGLFPFGSPKKILCAFFVPHFVLWRHESSPPTCFVPRVFTSALSPLDLYLFVLPARSETLSLPAVRLRAFGY
jgi:hypothetical protein